jgi:hypothetical protein
MAEAVEALDQDLEHGLQSGEGREKSFECTQLAGRELVDLRPLQTPHPVRSSVPPV